jgi:hypothetical protein
MKALLENTTIKVNHHHHDANHPLIANNSPVASFYCELTQLPARPRSFTKVSNLDDDSLRQQQQETKLQRVVNS